MVRDHSIEEFESLFSKASIPIFDIPKIEFRRVALILTGASLDAVVLQAGKYLHGRFGAAFSVHWKEAVDADMIESISQRPAFTLEPHPFTTETSLIQQVASSVCQLVVFPFDVNDASPVVSATRLIEDLAPPVLLMTSPFREFTKTLHCLTVGDIENIRNFAYSFNLVETNGELLLLHVIEESDIEQVAQALQVSPKISEKGGDELLRNLKEHAEQYLKGMVASRRDHCYEVNYRLAVGGVLPEVQSGLRSGDFGLLIIGSHREGRSHVDADEYQLMHLIKDIPILAL